MNKSKLIFFIVPDKRYGGSERIIQILVDHCLKFNYNYKLIFLSQYGNTNEFWKKYNSITLSNNKFTGLIKLFRFLYLNKSDFIFSSQIYINSFLGIFKKINIIKSKVIIRESTDFYKRFSGYKKFKYSLFHQIGYKYSDLLIFQSSEMYINFFNNYTKKIKYMILMNPLNKEELKGKSNKKLEIKKPYFMTYGRLIPEKGFNHLIKAYSKSKNKIPDLYIFGDGPQKEQLKKLIYQLGLNKKVFLKKYVKNPFPYVKNADGCIVSSIFEGFPNVLNEMIFLNDRVLSTICVDDIKKIPFILKSNNFEKFDEMLILLNTFKLSEVQKKQRLKYVKNLSSEVYFNEIFK